jgi:hypothetical protein
VLRLASAAALASRSLLVATVAWFSVLAAVYATDAGARLPAMAFTAAALFPISAWATAAALAAGSADLRAVLTAADGVGRVLLADALLALSWVVGATAAGVAANALFDAHPARAGDVVLGAALHLLCGAAGGGLALLLEAAGTARGVQALVVLAATVVSGRVAVLPPVGTALSAWGADRSPSTAAAVWSLAGPVLLTAVLVPAAGVLRWRRG